MRGREEPLQEHPKLPTRLKTEPGVELCRRIVGVYVQEGHLAIQRRTAIAYCLGVIAYARRKCFVRAL